MESFNIFPAIDLRQGQVVRLMEGDPQKQTVYSPDPSETAQHWLNAGAKWLHVVNLDGAFNQPDLVSRQALESIMTEAQKMKASVQFGGGLRTLEAAEAMLSNGVQRVILGTLAIEDAGAIPTLIHRWSAERLVVSLDVRDGVVQTHGWKNEAMLSALDLARTLADRGLRWLIVTDVNRDGMQQGLNIELTRQVQAASGLNVIAAGGVAGEVDIFAARDAGLAGVVIGKALYEGKIDLARLIHVI